MPDDQPLHETLRELPLLDEVFLGMQAMNVDLVDGYLRDLEADLLREYIEAERTPIASAAFVSAVSQMWVFAAYELMRTWRQRAREVVNWSNEAAALTEDGQANAIAAKRQEVERRASETLDPGSKWDMFERATDPQFAEELRSALDRTEVAYRSIEAVRMTLAKHEVPRSRGMYAGAAGYGRIDMSTGSIYWQVELGKNEVAVTSRADLSDALHALSQPNDRILPVAIQDQVANMPRYAYGLTRVAVVLEDGTHYGGVHVAWGTEVVRIEGHDRLPFAAAQIALARSDPPPEALPADDAPF
jgi:hypothetical protein